MIAVIGTLAWGLQRIGWLIQDAAWGAQEAAWRTGDRTRALTDRVAGRLPASRPRAEPASPLRPILGWLLVGLAIGLVVALALPTALGGRSLTVLSGSMEPAISTGDVLAVEGVRAGEVSPGEIITFEDSEGSSRLITHRVVGVRQAGETAHFVTKGDANDTVERWSIAGDGEVGRVMYRVPKVGYLARWTGAGDVRFLLIAIPALLLCGWELASIWRRPREDSDG